MLTCAPHTGHRPAPRPHLPTQLEALPTITAGLTHNEGARTPHNKGDQHPHATAEAVMGNSTVIFDPKPHQYVQSVWAGTMTAPTTLSVMKPFYGTNQNPCAAPEISTGSSSTRVDKPFVGTSSAHVDAPARTISTNVLGAVTPTMVHRDAPAANQLFQRRRTEAVTPHRVNGWQSLLSKYSLDIKSGSTPVGGPVKSGRSRTKEESRGLDKRLVRLELVTTWIQRLRIMSVDPLRRFRSRGDGDGDGDGQKLE